MSCPDCFNGSVHDGEARGKITQVYGLDCYVSEPLRRRPTRGIIVILPDCWGWASNNNRLLADRYAEKGGYKVYLPDFMNGEQYLVIHQSAAQKWVVINWRS